VPEEVAHTGLAQALPSISIKAADTVRAIEEEGRTCFAIKADSADPTARVPSRSGAIVDYDLFVFPNDRHSFYWPTKYAARAR
jgi:hypothetical protein